MSERQVPFYCPYCGEETLRPAGPTPASGSALPAPAASSSGSPPCCGPAPPAR